MGVEGAVSGDGVFFCRIRLGQRQWGVPRGSSAVWYRFLGGYDGIFLFLSCRYWSTGLPWRLGPDIVDVYHMRGMLDLLK